MLNLFKLDIKLLKEIANRKSLKIDRNLKKFLKSNL